MSDSSVLPSVAWPVGSVCERTPSSIDHTGQRWFRYDEEIYEDGSVVIHCGVYFVRKITKAGVWLDRGRWSKPKFVLREARKRWACPTPDEAKASFRSRKQRQARILNSQLAVVEACLDKQDGEFPVPAPRDGGQA